MSPLPPDLYPIDVPTGDEAISLESLQSFTESFREAAVQAVADAELAVPEEQRAVIAMLYAPGTTDLTTKLGNGAATVFDYAHGLGSAMFTTEVYSLVGARDTVTPHITRPDDNTVRVDFGSYVPAVDEFRLVVLPRGVVNTQTAGRASVEYVDARVDLKAGEAEARLRAALPDLAAEAGFLFLGA